MAKIELTELAGAELFASQEGFMDSMRDLSEDELKISGGSGHKGSGKSKSKSKSKSGSGGYGGGCGCGGYC